MKVDTVYGLAGAVYCYAFYSAIIDNIGYLQIRIVTFALVAKSDYSTI